MDPARMQIIGVCRFSYPAIGGFQVDHDRLEDRLAFLYDPARMEDRFAMFESFTLPALQAQTDRDFMLLVIIGDSMPEPWRTRLCDLLLDLPQAVIDPRPPGPHRQVMKDAINAQLRDTGQPSLQFRMDDDDAVAVDFIARLREVAGQCAGMITANRHVAIDFNQGYAAAPAPEGLLVSPLVEPMRTAALAISVLPGFGNTILNFSHRKMWRRMPVIGVPGEDMFVRGHSEFNDSRQVGFVGKVDLKPADRDTEAHFRARFNISADQIRARFRRA